MLKRVVSKYDKNPPNLQVDEFPLSCTVDEMRHLFDVDDDVGMICCYEIKTPEQINFFKNLNVPVDRKEGYFFVECYEE